MSGTDVVDPFRVLRIYVKHYNLRRPHRRHDLTTPSGPYPPDSTGTDIRIEHRDLLGGLVREYERAA